jgi:hypothetical protein
MLIFVICILILQAHVGVEVRPSGTSDLEAASQRVRHLRGGHVPTRRDKPRPTRPDARVAQRRRLLNRAYQPHIAWLGKLLAGPPVRETCEIQVLA